MLELFGIDFLYRDDKKSAGISYPGCQTLFTRDFRFRSSRYYWVVIVTRTKSEVFSRDFAARDLTCDKCPSSLYVWETRGKGRVLFFPLSSEKKNRLIASHSWLRPSCEDVSTCRRQRRIPPHERKSLWYPSGSQERHKLKLPVTFVWVCSCHQMAQICFLETPQRHGSP